MIGRWLCRIGRHKMIEELGLGALSIWSCERRGCTRYVVLSNWNTPATRVVRPYLDRALPNMEKYQPLKLRLGRQKAGAIPPSLAEEEAAFRTWADADWPPPVKPEPRPNVGHVFRPYRHR